MIITKDQKMKEVFGLGYPSAPIYTVEEFGEKQFEIMKQQERVRPLLISIKPGNNQLILLSGKSQISG